MKIWILGALGLVALGVYALAMSRIADRYSPSRQRLHLLAFVAGLTAAFVGFVPSPALLGADHRFTTNMGQLLLMLEVAAPLLLLGLHEMGGALPPRWEAFGRRLTAPLLAGVISGVVLVAWHLPPLFEKASGSLAIWSFKEALLLGVGLLAWSPVAAPLPAWRSPYPVQLLYLFLWRTPMVILGAMITFADGLIYTGRSVGLEICAPASLSDQRTAGLVMLALSSVIVFGTSGVVFFRWAAEE